MRVFLSIVLLVALALIVSSRLAFRVRRARPVMVLESGGWLAMGVGVLLGPEGSRLIDARSLEALTPVLLLGLGQIGLLVGLGLRWELLAGLPRRALVGAGSDALVSGVGIGLIAATGLGLAGVSPVGVGAAVLACGGLGWAMETRSLRVSEHPRARWLAVQLRAGGTLGAVLALALYAPVSSLKIGIATEDDGIPALMAIGAQLLGCAGVGVTMGVIGRFALVTAGRSRGDQLAVMLGIVAMVTGVSTQLGLSAAFAAMVAGATVANLGGADLRAFERFVLKTEHIVAALFAVLAGTLITLDPGWWLIGTAVAIAAARLALKPALQWSLVRMAARRRGSEAAAEVPARSPLYLLPARQAPIAMVIGVSAWIASPTELSVLLVTMFAISGVAADLMVLALTRPTAPIEEEGDEP
jgi:hypothetical protein